MGQQSEWWGRGHACVVTTPVPECGGHANDTKGPRLFYQVCQGGPLFGPPIVGTRFEELTPEVVTRGLGSPREVSVLGTEPIGSGCDPTANGARVAVHGGDAQVDVGAGHARAMDPRAHGLDHPDESRCSVGARTRSNGFGGTAATGIGPIAPQRSTRGIGGRGWTTATLRPGGTPARSSTDRCIRPATCWCLRGAPHAAKDKAPSTHTPLRGPSSGAPSCASVSEGME